MYFKLGKGTAWLFGLWCCLSFMQQVHAQQADELKEVTLPQPQVQFSATPGNCIALHQGRKCFARVALFWQTSTSGNFCIYQKIQNKVIQCWKNSRGSTTQFEFESSEKLEYQLVSIDQNRVLAETVIEVSWVHKATARKRRWRLF
jgi:hypothetical protein